MCTMGEAQVALQSCYQSKIEITTINVSAFALHLQEKAKERKNAAAAAKKRARTVLGDESEAESDAEDNQPDEEEAVQQEARGLEAS